MFIKLSNISSTVDTLLETANHGLTRFRINNANIFLAKNERVNENEQGDLGCLPV